jgi:hypothetical protein
VYETRQEQPRIEEGKTKEKRKADNISGTEPQSKKSEISRHQRNVPLQTTTRRRPRTARRATR